MALSSPEEYEQVRSLVEGNFSDATLVRRKVDDSQFVVKKVDLTKILEQKYRQIAAEEAANLTGLHHPNIIRVHNHFCQLSSNGHLIYHLVTELCDTNWTLADELEKVKKNSSFFSENHVLWWSNQLISALKYLHSKDIVHRNVRPNNIYLVNSNRDIKLGEYGFVKHEENNFLPQQPEAACTMSYLSPEFLQGNHPYCKKCDLWAMGVVLFECVSQKMPQNHGPQSKLQFPLKTSNVYSKELLHFIRWVLSSDDNERPAVDKVVDHPLMGENRVDQIRTIFGVARSGEPRQLKVNEAEMEPWKFHGRSSTIKQACHSWISGLHQVKGKDYILATSYSGVITAISKDGDTVLWKAKIISEGRGGLWHAAVDDRRGRLLVSYNGTDDAVNLFPVDIYSVALDKLEPQEGAPPTATVEEKHLVGVKAELFFHHQDWRCYGLRVDPVDDLLYVCDWFDNKIGIWHLDGVKPHSAPVHVITRPEQFKHFNPTRVALIPQPKTAATANNNGDKNAKTGEDTTVHSIDEPKEQLLAVTDWLRSRIYLFKTTSIRSTINHEFVSIITSKGGEVGLVAAPIDIQCDPSVRTLVVADQANFRAQVLYPDPEWPKFKAIATDNLDGHFSAIAITDMEQHHPLRNGGSQHPNNGSNTENNGSGSKDEASTKESQPINNGATEPTSSGAQPKQEGWEASNLPPGAGRVNGNSSLRNLMVGLNTGDIVSYKFKCG